MVKARLLVVDDEPPLLDLFTRKLERLSYRVFKATSGKEALDILQREEIDVLITDFQLPGMDGCEIITRAMKIDSMIQSIVITGYGDIKTVINAMGAGAFNYLQKPIDFSELDVAIGKGLEKRKLIQDVHDKQQQLEEYSDQLEELVEERTHALTTANLKLKREIEERKCLENSLREAKVQAENANRAKSEFLANMSHEIRTPMTSAIGLLDLVLDTKLLPKQKAYLEMARISTVVMHNLLNDILDFSKIEAGKLNLESIPFKPRKVIESVIDLQHFQAKEKSIQLSSSIANDVPESVVGDPNRLRQIILNLVSNAIKFTQYGEVTIECRLTTEEYRNTVAPDRQHVHLHFSVQDSGIGIGKDKIGIIFEAFSQADNSTTREFGGVGLGLNICSKLVALMGGHIWVRSEPGKGSVFHCTTQFGVELIRDEKETEGVGRISDLPGVRCGENTTVLVVEDDRVIQLVVQEILEQEGYTVINASDGKTALHELDNQSFDFILLDLKLPEMNGYEVVKNIREREAREGVSKGQHLPIIALTGFASKDEKQKCLNAGMDGFLPKPFTIDQLLVITRKYVQDSSMVQKIEQMEAKKRAVPNTTILEGEIFNEKAALKKASDNKEIMVERIMVFLQKGQLCIERLRKIVAADGHSLLLEQEVQSLKDMAMEAGATNFGDELFSLLMQLRKKQQIKNALEQINSLEAGLECFSKEKRVQYLFGNFSYKQ